MNQLRSLLLMEVLRGSKAKLELSFHLNQDALSALLALYLLLRVTLCAPSGKPQDSLSIVSSMPLPFSGMRSSKTKLLTRTHQ
jgi:hypothetical protein